MMVTWLVGSVHATVPETDPRMTTRRLPVASEVGRADVLVATTVSASEAHRPSWCFMHTPGPMPVHSLSPEQERQVFVAVSQMGVLPPQWLLLVQRTHCPTALPERTQTGLLGSFAWHSSSDLQAPHVVAVQMGLLPEQFVLVRHSTHLLVDVWQYGVVVPTTPEQWVLLVHWTQAPVLAQ